MNKHKTIYLKDYTPYPFIVQTVDLRVELDPGRTRVNSRLVMQRKPAAVDARAPLELNGEHLVVADVYLDGRRLTDGEYDYDGKLLRLPEVGERCEVEIETVIAPEKNTALEGLYLSSGNYCTQC
jgi:aminopeptidase N